MKRIFKTRYFSRWMRKTNLTNAILCQAVEEIIAGLVDAELGGGIVKKRVAFPGRGKRGSVRTLLATNRNNRWFFLFGFEKNERDNITQLELDALKELAQSWLSISEELLQAALIAGELEEITHAKI